MTSTRIPPIESLPVELKLLIANYLAPDLPALHCLVVASRSFHAFVKTFWKKHLSYKFSHDKGSWARRPKRGLQGDWAKEVDNAFWIAIKEWQFYHHLDVTEDARYKDPKTARGIACWTFVTRYIRRFTGHLQITTAAVQKHGTLSRQQVLDRYDYGKLVEGDLCVLRGVWDEDKAISKARVKLVEDAKKIATRYGAEDSVFVECAEKVYDWLWRNTDAYDHCPRGSLRVFYEENMAEYRKLDRLR